MPYPADISQAPEAFTLISDTVLGADAASFDVQNIPQGYKHLQFILMGRGDTGAISSAVRLQFNGDTSAIYDFIEGSFDSGGFNGVAASMAQTSITVGYITAATATADRVGIVTMDIPSYSQTTFDKMVNSQRSIIWGTAAANMEMGHHGGVWRSTAAINRIVLSLSAGNFLAGSRLTLYGLG